MTNFKESNLSMTAKLAVNLIKIPSITPNDLGCLDLIKARLYPLGFNCITIEDSGTTNLLALHGTGSPFFLFLGHTDVVSPGNDADWSFPPFGAEIKNIEGTDYLQGRGSQDMKSSDAAMTEALVSFVEANPNHKGCVGILLTSNEEGDAKGGTPFVVEYLKEHNLIPDYCLVGEPSCVDTFGDTIKNGRRGSLTAHITVLGVQGHVAYPQRCDNAAAKAAKLMATLSETTWDQGSEFFPKSSFQITNIKCGTGAENVVPGECYFMCNWRFNDNLTQEKIANKVSELVNSLNLKCEIRYVLNGLPFVTKGGELLEALNASIEELLGQKAKLSTAGGTSDGRFIAPLGTKVVEFGPRSNLIHKVNEAVELASIDKLHQIYVKTLEKIFC